jgi:hypothetical protein
MAMTAASRHASRITRSGRRWTGNCNATPQQPATNRWWHRRETSVDLLPVEKTWKARANSEISNKINARQTPSHGRGHRFNPCRAHHF